ncbi:hypothetical protein [Ligilactobacillus agilis]|uniref:hypothetical protein n=1 Tax=Ligilactobacillus agilis TaxID=1601 RepID=UPI00255CFE3A|nr:hypothetical protein [Ligilactobacillus agilis]
MEILSENHQLTLKSKHLSLSLDPKRPCPGPILISHLYEEVFALLAALEDQTVYLHLDLLLYLQKYYRFKGWRLPDLNFVALPLGYQFQLADLTIEAFNNDDNAFGSLVCIISDGQSKLGYAPKFAPHGQHKKRIKLWKKAFSQADLDYFCLSQDLVAATNDFRALTEVGRQKSLTKYLQHLEAGQNGQILLSYEKPDRILTMQKTVLAAGFNLKLAPASQAFLQALFPFEEPVSQTEAPRDLVAIETLSASAFDARASLAIQPVMAPKEAKEFLNVIKAKEVIYL